MGIEKFDCRNARVKNIKADFDKHTPKSTETDIYIRCLFFIMRV